MKRLAELLAGDYLTVVVVCCALVLMCAILGDVAIALWGQP